jgi:hypothetical protein
MALSASESSYSFAAAPFCAITLLYLLSGVEMEMVGTERLRSEGGVPGCWFPALAPALELDAFVGVVWPGLLFLEGEPKMEERGDGDLREPKRPI